MAQMGADPEELDQLKRKFNTEAESLTKVVSTIGNQLKSVWWKGADADRFRGEWDSNYASKLRNIADQLKQAGEKVGKQAQEQRRVSGS